MVNVYKGITDSRMVIDVVMPGYDESMVSVKTAVKTAPCGEKTFVLKIKGEYARPTGETGKLVPRFAFDKVIDEDFKIDIDYIPLNGDYDTTGIKWAVKNGVMRISVPKTKEAQGVALEASTDNVNVVGTADDDE